jgi:PleD family two-component response regulator
VALRQRLTIRREIFLTGFQSVTIFRLSMDSAYERIGNAGRQIGAGYLRGQEREFSCSVHSTNGDAGADIDQLLHRADQARCAAKRAGRNRSLLWSGSLDL